jgi:hypothetical protein
MNRGYTSQEGGTYAAIILGAILLVSHWLFGGSDLTYERIGLIALGFGYMTYISLEFEVTRARLNEIEYDLKALQNFREI